MILDHIILSVEVFFMHPRRKVSNEISMQDLLTLAACMRRSLRTGIRLASRKRLHALQMMTSVEVTSKTSDDGSQDLVPCFITAR